MKGPEFYKVSGFSTGSNEVECRIPYDFSLVGNLQLALKVNEESYSNFY